MEMFPLKENDEELQMLLEISKSLRMPKRKSIELTRTEKAELSGRETENTMCDHLLRRGFNLSKTREFLIDDSVGSMEIDLMLLRRGVDPLDCPYDPRTLGLFLR